MKNTLPIGSKAVFTIVVAVASCAVARASVIAANGVPYAISGAGLGETFTLLETYNDWRLGTGNTKNGGAITTNASLFYSATEDYPNFTYTNGAMAPGFATDENATFNYLGSTNTVPVTITIPVAAGSGQIILWLGTASNDNSASLTADLPDTGGIEFTTNYGADNYQMWTLDYTSGTAQSMTISLMEGNNPNIGFFAVAQTTVPEPSEMELAMIGTMAAMTFKRKRRQLHEIAV